jgi:hypothetical protein
MNELQTQEFNEQLETINDRNKKLEEDYKKRKYDWKKKQKRDNKIWRLFYIVFLFTSIAAIALLKYNESDRGTLIDQIQVGTLLNIHEVSTAFNDYRRSRIETTQGIFFTKRLISARKGIQVSIKNYTSGKAYLCLSDRYKCREIIGTK